MIRVVGLTLAAGVFLALAGCSGGEVAKKEAIHVYYVDADQSKAAAEGKDFEDPSKVGPKLSEVGNPSLKQLTKEQDKAADAYVKHHNDPKAKEAYVVATVRLATATMAADELEPKVKYRTALKLYREALKIDPKNEEANVNSQRIIEVYKSLGRPVPGG